MIINKNKIAEAALLAVTCGVVFPIAARVTNRVSDVAFNGAAKLGRKTMSSWEHMKAKIAARRVAKRAKDAVVAEAAQQ